MLSKEAKIARSVGLVLGMLALLDLTACATPQTTPPPETTPEASAQLEQIALQQMTLDCSNALTSNYTMTTTLEPGGVFWLQKGENIVGQELGVELTYEGNNVLNHRFIEYLPLGTRPHVDTETINNNSSKFTIHSDQLGNKVFTTTIQSGGIFNVTGACEK